MGVVITISQPPATSTYDKWRVYRATSRTGSYSLIVTQAITDLTYFDIDGTSASWYKTCYYLLSATTESALSAPTQGLTTSYTTPRKVESFLQLGVLSDTSSPTLQEVTEIINRVEDQIDYQTGHAWRTRYSGTKSGQDVTAKYETYDLNGMYEYHTGRPVYLKHRKIKDLSAAEGDAFEIWTGQAWEDWLATKTESRASDYWLDYDRGILYINGLFFIPNKSQAIRIKCRYGEEFLDLGIEDIATKMVAIDILSGMDPRANVAQETGSVMTHSQRIDKWQKEIETKLDRYKEFQVPSIDM